ncbi:unnamed protein product [Choristocarpus tenellus]
MLSFISQCWGINTYGTLGIGSPENHGDESGEMGDNLPVVSCHRVLCWA